MATSSVSSDALGPLAGVLDAFAAPAPAPGGGAAAALAGAVAAALAVMVVRIAARRAAAASGEREARGEALRHRLLELAGRDGAAYEAVVRARRRPAPERPEAVERALVEATEVPLGVARAAHEVLGLCADAAGEARPATRSDLAVAATLAVAALEAAAITARANLADIADRDYAAAVAAELGRLGLDAATQRRLVAGGADGSRRE